ncbi:TOBE domain-containing protein [Nitratireductor luteus]
MHCRLRDGQMLVAEQREGLDLVPDEAVRFSWEPTKALVFSQSGSRAG